MKFSNIKIKLPNGIVKTFPYSSFDFYAYTNELEHNDENIIINLDDLSHSFFYETDKLSDEIVNKTEIEVTIIP